MEDDNRNSGCVLLSYKATPVYCGDGTGFKSSRCGSGATGIHDGGEVPVPLEDGDGATSEDEDEIRGGRAHEAQ